MFFPRREIENGQYRFVDHGFVVTHRSAMVKGPQNNALASIRGEGVKSSGLEPGMYGSAAVSNGELERPRAASRIVLAEPGPSGRQYTPTRLSRPHAIIEAANQ